MAKEKGIEKYELVWNEFIKSLIEARRCWRTLGKLREKYDLNVEQFPDENQKVLSRISWRSNFTVGIVRFLEFIARYGELDECLISVKRKEAKKEATEWQMKTQATKN